jgi:hypothetical protein
MAILSFSLSLFSFSFLSFPFHSFSFDKDKKFILIGERQFLFGASRFGWEFQDSYHCFVRSHGGYTWTNLLVNQLQLTLTLGYIVVFMVLVQLTISMVAPMTSINGEI